MSNRTKSIAYFDVVVIGAGSAGLCAAIAASKEGASVTVIEKMPFPGGMSRFAEGIFAAESGPQKERNIKITQDQAFKNHMSATNWRADAPLVRDFIQHSAQNIDWLLELGIEFRDVAADTPDGPKTWHLIKDGGKYLIETLAALAAKNGAQLMMQTSLTRIITGDKGQISGIEVLDLKAGETRQIDCKALILTSGGFASNPELLAQKTGLKFDLKPVIDMNQTGEPLQCAWDIGGAEYGSNVLMAIPCVDGETPMSQLWASGIQPEIWVNQNGERFCDETIYFQFPISANAVARQPGGLMYCIFDEARKEHMKHQGIPIGLGVYIPKHAKLADIDTAIEKGIEEGKAFKAESIKNLASKIGIPPEQLEKTIAAYNSHCHKKHDGGFAKEAEYLNKIEEKNFYAVTTSFRVFTTLGGLKINRHTEVLNQEGNVIGGLYAGGNCAGGMYGSDYSILTCGGALAFAVYSGLTAGRNSSEYLKKNQ